MNQYLLYDSRRALLGAIIGLVLSTVAATAGEVTMKEIAEKDWVLTKLVNAGKAVKLPAKRAVTMKVAADGKVSGKSAVNRYFGSIKFVDGKSCEWSKSFGSTRMAGPPEMMDIERNYFQALPLTKTVTLTDGVLTFKSDDGKALAEFKAKGEEPDADAAAAEKK